jgi:DNA-binding transcriptional ArsR family regulator
VRCVRASSDIPTVRLSVVPAARRPAKSAKSQPASPSDPSLVVARSSTAARRQVGPLGWAVLEELALAAAEHPDGGLVCEHGTRELAARLGLSKDTVARGLSRLIEEGMVRRLIQRDPASGRFGRCGYGLNLPDGLRASDVDPPLACPGAGDSGHGAPRRGQRAGTGASGQLSLLDSRSRRDG